VRRRGEEVVGRSTHRRPARPRDFEPRARTGHPRLAGFVQPHQPPLHRLALISYSHTRSSRTPHQSSQPIALSAMADAESVTLSPAHAPQPRAVEVRVAAWLC
jgi:hypothetical protein